MVPLIRMPTPARRSRTGSRLSDRRARRGRLPAVLLAACVLAMVLTMVDLPVRAAPPDASPNAAQQAGPSAAPPSPIIGIGDPRSSGAGPGLVGSPFGVLLGVLLLGAIAAGGTILYVRWARRGELP